jgi:hypothetical protein
MTLAHCYPQIYYQWQYLSRFEFLLQNLLCMADYMLLIMRLHFSPKSPDCLPDGSGGHIRIDRNSSAASLPVTNCHECARLSNLEKRRQEEARAVEPWLLLLLYE